MLIGGRRKSNVKSYNQLVSMIEREKSSTTKDPKTNPTKQLAEYKSWVSNCVSLRADTIKTVPFKFYRKDTDEEVTSRLHSYKTFSKPFLRPNPLMSMSFLKSFCQMQKDLCGMSCIYKVKNILGQIWEFWPLNMNDFFGVFANDGTPIEMCPDILPQDVVYVFMIGGKHYKFSDSELIINKFPHPKNPWIGASPVQLQAYAIDLQTYMEIYETDFFKNSARVDGILSTELDIDQSKADAIKERWREKHSYGAGGSFHDVAVLGSGLKFTPVEWANKDIEVMALANWSEDLVLGAYRTPKSKVGKSGDANRSASVYADIYYARESIAPNLVDWDDEFTEVLQEFDSRLYVKHDNPIPRDRQIEYQEARVYLSGAPTYRINEQRKIHKLPPDPNGDRILIPSNLIFLDRLDEVMDANLKAKENPIANETDPSRHDDDDPNVNPDGSDDRDDLPTDGRNFDIFSSFVKTKWKEKMFSFLWENKHISDDELKQNLIKLIFNLYYSFSVTASYNLKDSFDLKESDSSWIKSISEKIGSEMVGTISSSSLSSFNNIEEFTKYLNGNVRFIKICNFSINSCINSINNMIIEQKGLKKKWIVKSNNCGHL